jgi:hypothetical protein
MDEMNRQERQGRQVRAGAYHKDTKAQRDRHDVIPRESGESRNLSGLGGTVRIVAVVVLAVMLSVACASVKTKPDPNVANPSLRAKLLKMEAADQNIRKQALAQFSKTGERVTIPMLWILLRMDCVDKSNTKSMRRIVDKQGWPGKSMVGSDGASAAFLLVQHADKDTAFQKKCLPLLQEAAEQGDASKSDMAYLTDRILVAEGRKQLYGTQCSWKDTVVEMDPIEDSLHVDERRAEVGLEPLDVYMRATKFVIRHGSSVDNMMNPGSPAYDSLKEIYGPYFKDEDSLEK